MAKFLSKWREKGYNQDKKYFTGQMCSHKEKQPSWNDIFVKWTEKEHNLKDIGCCYYCMVTNEIIPVHGDNYKLYREKFNCELNDISRIIVFLEDWKSGHYFELDGKPFVNWKCAHPKKSALVVGFNPTLRQHRCCHFQYFFDRIEA